MQFVGMRGMPKRFCAPPPPPPPGPYNMYALADHLHRRGLYRNILHRLMSVEGKVMMRELSPSYVAR